MEKQVCFTYENIEKLGGILKKYGEEIKQMEINISSVSEMTGELSKVKKDYLIMQEKCKNINKLRTEVSYKDKKLKKLKENN